MGLHGARPAPRRPCGRGVTGRRYAGRDGVGSRARGAARAGGMHNTHSFIAQRNTERLDEAAQIDIANLPSFSPSERNESQRRRTSLYSSRDVKEVHQTPRKHSIDASREALSTDAAAVGPSSSPGLLHLDIPSPSGAESSQQPPKKYMSEFPLVQRLLNNQLRNNDFAFLEKLLLWNSDKDLRFGDREEPETSVAVLRAIRNMLMKDLVRTRFGLRGDVQNQDGSMRVSMSRTATEPIAEDSPKLEVSALERARAITWEFMENPNSSRAAYVVSVSILLLILLSSITFCMETVDSLAGSRPAFYVIEVVAIVCFTVEYVIRLLSCPELLPFLRAPLNIIDVIAILPFYIELATKGAHGRAPRSPPARRPAGPARETRTDAARRSPAGLGLGQTQVLRVVRLVRVFRVLKLGSKSGRLEVIITAVSDSTDMLVMLSFLLLLSMIVFSSLIYFAEKNTYNEWSGQHSFKSIPDAFWWCMVTLMTVGYGDAVPETPVGRLIATGTMLSSIIILALPISVIGTNFTSQWIIFKEQFKTRDRCARGAYRPNRHRRAPRSATGRAARRADPDRPASGRRSGRPGQRH